MDYKVTGTELTGIANAIRSKGGTSASLTFPSGFVSAISAISGGGSAVLGSKSISENGTYLASADNLDGFDQVVVDVQGGVTPSGSISISQNGTYDVSSFANAVVDVPSGGSGGDNWKICAGVMSGTIIDTELSYIGSSAQVSNLYITGVNLSVETVSNSAFQTCKNLSFAILPNCTLISDYAFNGCEELKSVSAPHCEKVGRAALGYCEKLSEISLPACSIFSTSTFIGCSMLQSAYLPSCERVEASMFTTCSELVSVSLPECKIVLSSAFTSCYKLPSINLPKCERIDGSAFYRCFSLSTIHIGNLNSVSGIKAGAFLSCSALMSVYILGSMVGELATIGAFNGTPIRNSTLTGNYGSIIVPASLVDAYKSADVWSDISDRITAYTE